MNQLQAIQLLNTLSISSFYGQAPVGTPLPFMTIHTEQPDNFVADNLVYCEKWNFRIDLYSVKKELEIEADIKSLLNDNGIAWTKTEQYISEQLCWEVEFEFEVMGNEDPTPEPEPPTPDPEPEPDDGEDEGGDGDGT